MTLILSCMTQEYVVQVSDRRLTDFDTGSVVEDQSNKTLFFCGCGQMAFAYTGLSRLGRLPTADWLIEHLARATSLPDGMEIITKAASSDLMRVNFPPSIGTEERRRRRRIAVVGVGFAMPRRGMTGGESKSSLIDDVDPIKARVPLMVLSSNFFEPPGSWSSLAERRLSWVECILARNQSHLLFPTGQSLTNLEYDDLRRRIRRCVEHKTSVFPVALAMVQAVRAVAKRNPLVGANLMCMVIPVGWPGGVSPPGSHRSRRDNLSSPGSCHPVHQDADAHAQWAKSLGSWPVMRCQAALAFLMGRSRLCLSRSQRIR